MDMFLFCCFPFNAISISKWVWNPTKSSTCHLCTCQYSLHLSLARYSLGRKKLQTSAVKTCIFCYLPREHKLYRDFSTSRSFKDEIKGVVISSDDTDMKFRAQINQLQDAFAWRGLGKLGLVIETKIIMAERKLASQTLQRFTELEELAEEIMEDKHQVKHILWLRVKSVSLCMQSVSYNLVPMRLYRAPFPSFLGW